MKFIILKLNKNHRKNYKTNNKLIKKIKQKIFLNKWKKKQIRFYYKKVRDIILES